MRFLLFAQRRDRERPIRCDATDLRQIAAQGALTAFAVISREDVDVCDEGVRVLLQRADPQVSAFVLFVRWRPAPMITPREDQPIESFVCSGPLCADLVRAFDVPRLASVYEVAQQVLESPVPVRIRAVQMRHTWWEEPLPPASAESWPRVNWVMPHAGSHAHLRSSVRGMAIANEPLGGTISVGIDDEEVEAHTMLCDAVDRCRVLFAQPSGSGPYHIRNALVARAEADIIIFQDSDDVPCEDRGVRLVEALAGSRHGTIGSHVVLVDTIERRVVPVRYPLDGTAALQRAATYPVLHPASAIWREQFVLAGGFSTLATHSMDRQFVLRSHFLFTSANVDRFLYLRRRRVGSLTTNSATKFGSLQRLTVSRGWQRDFEGVKRGTLRLDRSSIRPQHDPAQTFTLRESVYRPVGVAADVHLDSHVRWGTLE